MTGLVLSTFSHQLRQDKHQDMRQKTQKLTSASWLRPVCGGFHNLIRFNWAPFFASCRRHRVLTVTCLDACRCAAYLSLKWVWFCLPSTFTWINSSFSFSSFSPIYVFLLFRYIINSSSTSLYPFFFFKNLFSRYVRQLIRCLHYNICSRSFCSCTDMSLPIYSCFSHYLWCKCVYRFNYIEWSS
jgi:hypothetical protein